MSAPICISVIGADRSGKIHSENIAYYFPGPRHKPIANVNLTGAIEGVRQGARRSVCDQGSFGHLRGQGDVGGRRLSRTIPT